MTTSENPEPGNMGDRSTPQRLFLATEHGVDPVRLFENLSSAGLDIDRIEPLSADPFAAPPRDLIGRWQLPGNGSALSSVKVPEDAQLLLVFADPASSISEGLFANGSSEQVIDAWASRVTALLSVFRRNRSRTMLVNLHRTLAHPQSLVAALAECLGLDLVVEGTGVDAASAEFSRRWMLGDYILRRNHATRLLMAELEAGEIRPEQLPEPATGDLVALFAGLRDGIEEEVNKLRQENELLLLQLEEQAIRSAQVRSQRHEAQNQQRELRLELESLRAHTRDLAADLLAHQRAIEALQSSMSWKITAPLRWALKPFARNRE